MPYSPRSIARTCKNSVLFISFFVILQGCATVNGIPSGAVFSRIKGPLLITNDNQNLQTGYNTVGTSKSTSLFYVVNFGDASIEKAISKSTNPAGVKISHVDFQYCHFLGCGVYKTIVYYYDSSHQ